MAIDPKLTRYIIGTTAEKTAELPEMKREKYEKIGKGITVIWGLRGVGKTTLMLQHLKEHSGLYFKMDHFLFSSHKLYDIIKYFYSKNYKNFYLDEIHTYKDWFKELKDIYDDMDINIVASGSSAIALSEGKNYLARRSKFIHLRPLTFREYLEIKYKKNLGRLTIDEVLKNPQETIAKLEVKLKNIVEDFQHYIRYGGLPIVFSEKFYSSAYIQIINRIITYDLLYLNISRETILKAKKVIPFLAKSQPGEINLENISSSIGIAKGTLYTIIDAFKKAGLISGLFPYTSSAHVLVRKQPKIYFAHPSLRHNILMDIGESENIGAYREEFFFSAIKPNFKELRYIKEEKRNPDFIANKYIFEIGGPRKRKKKYKKKVIIVQDDINAQIPLLLFGFI